MTLQDISEGIFSEEIEAAEKETMKNRALVQVKYN